MGKDAQPLPYNNNTPSLPLRLHPLYYLAEEKAQAGSAIVNDAEYKNNINHFVRCLKIIRLHLTYLHAGRWPED